MTYKKTYMAGLARTRNRIMAVVYSVLIISSLSTGVLSQQLAQGQAGLVNSLATGVDDYYTAATMSKGYDNSFATSQLASYSAQPVHGQYWTNNAAQYPQPAYQATYPQYGSHASQYIGSQVYPSQYGYGYHPQQYGSYYKQNPGFDAYYWTGNMHNYQVPLPVHKPRVPMHVMPVHYPVHPAMHRVGHVMPRKYRSKGFLGGTGSGVVKGVLGAVLAGVVASKVVKGK